MYHAEETGRKRRQRKELRKLVLLILQTVL